MSKPSKIGVFIFSIFCIYFENVFCQNVKFEVRNNAEILSKSKQLAELKVHSEIDCHAMCAAEKDCTRIHYDRNRHICETYSDEPANETEVQSTRLNPDSTISQKVYDVITRLM